MQADDGEEASSPSSPTAASGFPRCVACPVSIPLDWPLRFQHCRSGWPATDGSASTWGKTIKGGEQANVVHGDDLEVSPTECTHTKTLLPTHHEYTIIPDEAQ